jgi:hypothetical protein
MEGYLNSKESMLALSTFKLNLNGRFFALVLKKAPRLQPSVDMVCSTLYLAYLKNKKNGSIH